MSSPSLKLTRNDLAKFLPDQRSIVAFEALFNLVPSAIDANTTSIEEVSYESADANARAQQALDTLERIAKQLAQISQSLDSLTLAPPANIPLTRTRFGSY